MLSPAVDPSSVLISAPVAPLNRYTAPASWAPASSNGAVTTTLPVLRASTECPNWFPDAGWGSTNSSSGPASSEPASESTAQHMPADGNARRVSLPESMGPPLGGVGGFLLPPQWYSRLLRGV